MPYYDSIENKQQKIDFKVDEAKNKKEARAELVKNIMPVLSKVDNRDKQRISTMLDRCSDNDAEINLVYAAGGSVQQGSLKDFMLNLGYKEEDLDWSKGFSEPQKEFITFALATAAKEDGVSFTYKENKNAEPKEFSFLYTDPRKIELDKPGVLASLVEFILSLFGVKSERILAEEAKEATGEYADKAFSGVQTNEENMKSAVWALGLDYKANYKGPKEGIDKIAKDMKLTEGQLRAYKKGFEHLYAIINRGKLYVDTLMREDELIKRNYGDVDIEETKDAIIGSSVAGALISEIANFSGGKNTELGEKYVKLMISLGSVSASDAEASLKDFFIKNQEKNPNENIEFLHKHEPSGDHIKDVLAFREEVERTAVRLTINSDDEPTINLFLKNGLTKDDRLFKTMYTKVCAMPEISFSEPEKTDDHILKHFADRDLFAEKQQRDRKTDTLLKISSGSMEKQTDSVEIKL